MRICDTSPSPVSVINLVFYRAVPGGGIEVFRVLHGARDIHGILAEEFGVEDADDNEAAEES
jgi:hypothetical protein